MFRISSNSPLRFVFYTTFIFLLSFTGCIKENLNNEPEFDPAKTFTLNNVSYGNDPQQKIDIYLPANRSSNSTKVFILIHGGGWVGGDKADFNDLFNTFKSSYPNHAIVNINYRLGTLASPGYPKQINDIQSVIDHIQLNKYDLSSDYFLFGASAGGHLSMLYAYAFDPAHHVKGICNIVGPTDLTDTSYTNHVEYNFVLGGLVGNYTYSQNPAIYAEVSPAKKVTPFSPKTISFYGSLDPLIPVTQMTLLQNALDANGVYSEATMYQGDGHGNWSPANAQDCLLKILNFIEQHFK